MALSSPISADRAPQDGVDHRAAVRLEAETCRSRLGHTELRFKHVEDRYERRACGASDTLPYLRVPSCRSSGSLGLTDTEAGLVVFYFSCLLRTRRVTGM